MIRDVNDLLVEARKYLNPKERIDFVTSFLVEVMNYDYASMMLGGVARGNITSFTQPMFEKNFFKTANSEEIAICQKIETGKSEMFDKIMEIRDENAGNYHGFISCMREYIHEQLKLKIDNDDIVNSTENEIMEKIDADMKKEVPCRFQNVGVKYINRDISKIMASYMIDTERNFPAEIKKGILVKGVCQDFAEYLTQILTMLGIESHTVVGTNELGHAWNLIRIGEEYKMIDLNTEIFIRDSYRSCKGKTRGDMMFADVAEVFEMFPLRTIRSIDGVLLPETITAQNYEKLSGFIEEIRTKESIDEKEESADLAGLKQRTREKYAMLRFNIKRKLDEYLNNHNKKSEDDFGDID